MKDSSLVIKPADKGGAVVLDCENTKKRFWDNSVMNVSIENGVLIPHRCSKGIYVLIWSPIK
jgi:hypothetical protein